MNQTPLDRAIVEAGSGVALASVIGVTPMAVSHWRVRGVPAHQVLAIESATGVSRYDLRPDIYPRQSLTLNVNLRAGVRALKLSDFSSYPSHKSEVFAGPTGFWLQVTGNSMVSASGVSFPEGYLILVSPEMDPRPGQFIVARLTDRNEATFKQLAWDAGEFFMKPLNPAYPTKLMGDEWEIVGTVVDAKIPRSVFE